MPSACWLVWVAGQDAATTTEVCEVDETLVVGDPEPGMSIVVDGARRALVVREVRADAWTCDWRTVPPERLDAGREVVGRTLELAGDAGPMTLLELPELDGAEEVVDELEVLTTLGPYVAVRRSLLMRVGCGAHAYGQVTYSWHDARSGEPLDVLAEMPGDRDAADALMIPLVRAEAPDLLTWRRADELARWADERRVMVEGGLMSSEAGDRELARRIEGLWASEVRDCARIDGLIPAWDGTRWRGHHHATFSVGDAFAPLEVLLPAVDLPAPLAGWQPPPPVVRYLASRTDVVRFGWSAVPR